MMTKERKEVGTAWQDEQYYIRPVERSDTVTIVVLVTRPLQKMG